MNIELKQSKRPLIKTEWLIILMGTACGAAGYFLPLKYCLLLPLALVGAILVIKDLKIGILGVAFLFPFIPTILTIGLVDFILLVFIVNTVVNKPTLKYGPMGIWIVLFGAINLFTAIFSVTPLASIQAALAILSFLALYFVLINTVTDRKFFYLLVLALIISASLQSLYGIYQYQTGISTIQQHWTDAQMFPELNTRVFGTLDNPNILAQYLELIIPLTLGLFWSTPDRLRKVLLLGAASLMIVCLLLTYSRAGWVAFALSVIVFAILRDRRILLVAGIAGLLGLYFLPGSIMERAASIGNLSESSNTYRIFIWKASLKMIRDFWYSGVGLGVQAFAKIYNGFYIREGVYAFHTHNLYLQILVETGILGLTIFLACVYKAFKFGLNAVVRSVNNIDKTIIVAILAGILALLLHGLTENSFYNFKIIFMFWFSISLIMTMRELGDNT